MKVCAHVLLGPFNPHHEKFDTIGQAKSWFKRNVSGTDYGTGESDQVMDIYPQCEDCNHYENYHDYPMARYVVGPRQGVRKEYV